MMQSRSVKITTQIEETNIILMQSKSFITITREYVLEGMVDY
jgi:hypothetical protein